MLRTIEKIIDGVRSCVASITSHLAPVLSPVRPLLAPITRRLALALKPLRPLTARIQRYHIILAVLTFIIFLGAFFLPGGVMDRTSLPGFCASCHVMDKQYEHWSMTGLHRSITCADCHLPHTGPIRYYTWKGIDGTKDVIWFFGRLYSDNTRITVHGASVVQENCLRCHENMVSRINTDGRTCWSCHRRVSHTVIPVSMTSQ